MKFKMARWQSHLILLGILLVAFWLRVYKLEEYPAGLHFDEAANAILSSEIAFDTYRPIFISSYTGKETLFFYAAGLLMNRIGVSVFTLRLTASVMGLVTLAVTYRLAIQLLKRRRDGLIATLLLGANFAHLLFSRLGFRAISQPLLQGLTVLFLIEGMRRYRLGHRAYGAFCAAGLCLGLTAHTYLAARLFPFALAIPLIIFGWLWVKDGKDWATETRPLINHFLLMGLIGLVALAPLLYWFIANPQAFWVRIEQVGDSSAGITRWQGLVRAGSMLFFSGDPYIRFNIPGMALFSSPLMLFPAVQGIRLAWHERGQWVTEVWLGNLIMVVAPIVMLLPSALATSEIVPSNLRAIGIFPFIVLPIASGLGWMIDYVVATNREKQTLQMVIASLVVLFLFAGSLYQPWLYFTAWGPSEAAFLETEGDVKAVADYLNSVQTDRPILVSTRFVPHPTLAFLADDYDQLPLIPNGQTLVYPAGERPLILFPASSPEPAWIAQLPGDRETYTTESGIPAFSTFAPAGDLPSPQTPANGNFGFAVELLGYDLQPGKVGQTMQLRTSYKVLGNPGFNMVPFVHLEDHLGNRWGQLEQPGYSPANWQTGDRFIQQFEMAIPAGLPPTNNYTLRIGWFDGDTGQEVTRFDENNQFAGAAFLIEGVALEYGGQQILDIPNGPPLNAQVQSGLTYLNWQVVNQQANYFQGAEIDFTLWWRADSQLTAAKIMTILEQDDVQIELERVDPAGDSYPFDQWQTPISIIDQHRVQIPADVPPGNWEFNAYLVQENSPRHHLLSTRFFIDELDLILAEPPSSNPVGVNFEGQLRLVGYSLDAATGELELVWQKIGNTDQDFVAFIHLQNADATCCVWQADRPMMSSAARPTSRWLVDEYVIERFEIETDKNGLPLVVGVYRPENGIRLKIDGSDQDQVQLIK